MDMTNVRHKTSIFVTCSVLHVPLKRFNAAKINVPGSLSELLTFPQ